MIKNSTRKVPSRMRENSRFPTRNTHKFIIGNRIYQTSRSNLKSSPCWSRLGLCEVESASKRLQAIDPMGGERRPSLFFRRVRERLRRADRVTTQGVAPAPSASAPNLPPSAIKGGAGATPCFEVLLTFEGLFC